MTRTFPSRTATPDEVEFVHNQLMQVKRLNRAWGFAYALTSIVLAGTGGVFIHKGTERSAFYLVGGTLSLLGLFFLALILLDVFTKKRTSIIDTRILIHEISGQLRVQVTHHSKGGPSYRFFIGNHLLYLPNVAFVNTFRKLDQRTLKLSVCKVPSGFKSLGNMGRAEYLVLGIFDYLETTNGSSAVYSAPIKRLSGLLTFFIMLTIVGFVLYQEEGPSIVLRLFPAEVFTGSLQYIPHLLFSLYGGGFAAAIATMIIVGRRFGHAVAEIEAKIEEALPFVLPRTPAI